MPRNRTFLNYFGADEKPTVARWTAVRDRAFHALCQLLARHNVHSDTITFLGFSAILFFFVPFFGLGWYGAAWTALIVHLLLDAVDGPLARITGSTSNRGALADIMNDITGMVLVVAVAVHESFIHPTVGVLYVAFYLYLTMLTIALNAFGAGYRVVLKSKYWLYIALFYTVHSGFDAVNPLAVASIVYSMVYTALAYMRLRDRLPETMDVE